MDIGKTDLRWGIKHKQRLEFIEFRLFWEGHVNKGNRMEAFGVSVSQASTDLNSYVDMASKNMVYNKSARAYVRGLDFSPIFLKPDASHYLVQLRSVVDGILGKADAWIGQPPEFDAAPTPVWSVDPKARRTVVAATRRKEKIKYQSRSRPEPRQRWMASHAIGYDGFLWHIRGLCEIDQAFKDVVLSRIMETRGVETRTSEPVANADWHEHVVLLNRFELEGTLGTNQGGKD